jgi:Tfp pilus assembly protein PilV
MTELIVAFVLMLVAVTGAELVRMTCRRQLSSPVRPARTAAASATTKLQLSR